MVPQATAALEQAERKPAASDSAARVREKINDMIRQNLSQLTKSYHEGMKKEAEKQAMKKPARKETIPAEAKKKAT